MKVQNLLWAMLMLIPAGLAESKAAGSAVLQAFKSLDIRYFIAGGTCAAISHGITTPIDVVKTKIQSNPRKYNKGMASTAVELVKEDGASVLLGGLGPTVVGYGIEGAMKFGVYEVMKPVFAEIFKKADGSSNTALAFLLASAVAGAVASLILCPMESTRIKMVTDRAYKEKNLLTGLAMIVKDEGLGSIFGSIWAMLAKQVPYTFGKQVSFDVFAIMLYKLYRDFEDKVVLNESQIKWVVSVASAFLASLVACIFSQPGDMILTETFRKPTSGVINDANRRKFGNVVKRLHDEGGIPQFFTGTGARIVHVSTIITSQLVIYDIVKQMLGLPATGSH
eukprot:CAMPEP_0198138346 /NCGR_PEP_ID=MMETSP1443-20131203/1744_1 /TAXON_ID=186043 /ORGANISM="Entomoneis sp., Strain CCMP2396" /LENGTH=336 /DNA_ID=CAMNT_0043800075 /DNA_START=185 /DNA_END=1195 /DNA_ORIENTATION=-